MRTGIDPAALQAGDVHSLSIYPNNVLTGENSFTIRYDDDDITGGTAAFSDQSSIRIFRWNDAAQQWEIIGGEVDTAHNEVTALLTQTGTYAAFTTELPTGVGEGGDSGLPRRFEVRQNYPNPFNPTTVISYSIPVAADVTIDIYNVLGERVRTFRQGKQIAGTYSVIWHADNDRGEGVASGIYFYRVTAGNFQLTKKMILLK